jgi:hypothetical protein
MSGDVGVLARDRGGRRCHRCSSAHERRADANVRGGDEAGLNLATDVFDPPLPRLGVVVVERVGSVDEPPATISTIELSSSPSSSTTSTTPADTCFEEVAQARLDHPCDNTSGMASAILCRRVFLSVTDWCPRRGGRCGPRMAAGQLEAGPAESTNEFHPRGSSKCS